MFLRHHTKTTSHQKCKKKFTILNVRKNQLNMVRAITPAIALKLIRFLLTMNWGGGGVWGLIMFWFQFLVYLLLLINIFAITVLKNHRWYRYARYKVCPLLCDTYLESAHYNFPVIFKYMPISTWLNRKSLWKVMMLNTSIWISFRVISNGKFRNCFIFCIIPYSRKVRETNI